MFYSYISLEDIFGSFKQEDAFFVTMQKWSLRPLQKKLITRGSGLIMYFLSAMFANFVVLNTSFVS